jgi:hypothetical protein
MKLIKKGFTILPDNDIVYFQYMEGLINSVDEYAEMEVSKNPSSYSFRITPSLPIYSQQLLSTIVEFHTMISIKLDLGKSIKKNSSIFFTIPIK